MATDQERLLVRIEAQLRQFERAMGQATRGADKAAGTIERRFRTMETRLSRVGSGLAGAFGVGLGVGALKELTRSISGVVKETADLGDQADRIGITAEQLQELSFQASQTGSSAEAMGASLERFSKNLAEARTGSGELYKLLKANGVALDDLKRMDVNQALQVFVDLIGKAADESDRAKIATIGFGKGGQELGQTFAGGTAAMRDFADVAHRTHQILTNEVVKSAQDVDDKFAALTGTISTMLKQGLLEFLQTTAHEIEGIGSAIDALQAKAHTVGQELKDAQLQHLREMKAAGQLPGVVLPFPGKEKDDLALPSAPSSRAKFPGKEKDDLARFTIIPADKIEESAKARGHSSAAIDREARSLATHNKELETQNFELERNDEAQQEIIDRLDEMRFAASSALDSFAQSIQNGEGAAAGLKAALTDILQTIIRIGEQKAIASLFGAPGTGGGGFLSGIIGGLFGGAGPASALAGVGSLPTSAAPSRAAPVVQLQVVPDQMFVPVVTSIAGDVSVKHADAAENRAVGRAPAVARNNSRRFGTP